MDPRQIFALRSKQLNVLKLRGIDFRTIMDIFLKYEGGKHVTDNEAEQYDNAIKVLKRENCIDAQLNKYSRAPVDEMRDAHVQQSDGESAVEQNEEAAAIIENEPENIERLEQAKKHIDIKECTWLIGVLDKYLKTSRRMDHRISLEFRFHRKQGEAVLGQIDFLVWSNNKLSLPVLVGSQGNLLFIHGNGLDVVIDGEGRIKILDLGCLATLGERHQTPTRA